MAQNLTFNANGYTLLGNGGSITLDGSSTITSAAGTSNVLQVPILGTNGISFRGTGVSYLEGDNFFTGGVSIHSGTVVLQDLTAGKSSGSPYAIDGVAALDTGATLIVPGVWNGATYGGDVDQFAINAQNSDFPRSFLHMTGGTLDLNNDPGTQHFPVPDGTGTIVNNGSWSQTRLQIYSDGLDHTFNGVIADGNNGVLNGDNTAADNGGQGPGYQIGAIWIVGGVSTAGVSGGASGPYQTWYWYGSNTCSASLRLDNGVYLKLMGPNANIGNPSPVGLTGPMRLYNGVLDLNGHNQTVDLMTHGGNGIIQNTAAGTVATLTIGYGNEQVFSRWCGYTLQDNFGGGGALALTKINTAPYPYPVVNPTTIASNCVQEIRGSGGNPPASSTAVCTYSGDTTLLGGGLILTGTSTVSSNSAYKLWPTNSYTLLTLNYTGTAPCRQLWINGVQQPNGVYGSISNTLGATPVAGIDPASTGTLTVTASSVNVVWDDGSKNYVWDHASTNWSGQTWSDYSSAVFGPTDLGANGIGTVNVSDPILLHNLTFTGNGYTLGDTGGNLTFDANATITSASGTSNMIQVGIQGSNGVSFGGTGVSYLEGPDSYTGGTYIHSGTVVLQSQVVGKSSGSPYAIDGVAALDTGATLVVPGLWNGATYVGDPDQFGINGQNIATPQSFLHMTGGTLDLNNDPGTQHFPVPDGTGRIVNNGSWSQTRLQIYADGLDHTFNGVIADGNNGVLNGDNTAADNAGQGPGYQIGAIWVVGGTSTAGVSGGAAGPYQYWYWYGSNTCSASLRLDNGVYLKLMGPNANIGNPSPVGLTGPMRLYNGVLDLNGHNQTVDLMTHGGNGIIQNTAVGTVSTLTIGYGNEQVFSRYAAYTLQDSWGGGGVLALKKINTAPYPYPVVGPTTIASNCVQDLRGVCTYSGDTTLLGGGLILSAASAVSPNSAYRISTPNSYTLLTLNYSGTAPCRQLWINGVQKPNGVYGAIGNTLGAIPVAGIDPASTGTLTVTGYSPAKLNATPSSMSGGSNSLNFSWSGVYKLQSKTNLNSGVWQDVPGGGTSPVIIPVDKTKKSTFFRLATY